MRKIIYIFSCVFIMAVVFSSCEMKDELTGKNMKTSYGDVLLNVSNSTSGVNSRNDANYSGEVIGSFPEEDVNVNNYILKIIDTNGAEVEGGGKISEIGQDGKVSLSLLEGKYTLRAYNYDGSNVSVSEKPYFIGVTPVTVESGVDTESDVVCKLNNIQVALFVDESFNTKFSDDYEFTVDNGEDAIQIIKKENVGKKYYFKVPENKNYLTVTAKANKRPELGGQEITKTFQIYKPANADGDNTLVAADAFSIYITDEENTASFITIGMTVDFTFIEQNENITIPVEDIVFEEETTEPEPGPDPEPEPVGPITFEGLPAEYTDPADSGTSVVVNITAENGIKNLNVNISSDNSGFTGIISTMQLTQFDLVNPIPGDQKDSLVSLGLYDPKKPIEGATEYVFDVTGFMALLPSFGLSTNTFSIEVIDAQGNSKSGDLKVVITKENE